MNSPIPFGGELISYALVKQHLALGSEDWHLTGFACPGPGTLQLRYQHGDDGLLKLDSLVDVDRVLGEGTPYVLSAQYDEGQLVLHVQQVPSGARLAASPPEE